MSKKFEPPNAVACPKMPATIISEAQKDYFVEKNGEKFAGMHLLADLWGASNLSDPAYIDKACREAAITAGATILHSHFHHFSPNGGVSGVVVLAESHITIHTWPERDFAAVDIFMCGACDPHKSVTFLKEAFKPENVTLGEHRRGLLGSASNGWVNERLYPDWAQSFRVKHELAHVKSPFQDIHFVESHSHGRVMLLDGVVQITERDEFVYQEMLAHVPLLAHGNPSRVLIIGAGDGGVLRRVLEHRSVTEAVMVEIDGEVIRLSKELMPGIAGDAWNDPRANVIVGDGIDYVKKAAEKSFDVIIVDSTDPIGVGEVLFTDDFYANAARILTDRGVIVNQCGVPAMQADELRDTSLRRAKVFPHVTAYVAAVPTYVGGFMTLGWAGKDPAMTKLSASQLRARAKAAGILGRTQYWTPDIHAAAFKLPPYIAQHLPQAGKVVRWPKSSGPKAAAGPR